jgi:hypothetical protein
MTEKKGRQTHQKRWKLHLTFTLSMTFQMHNTKSKQKDPVDPGTLSLSLSLSEI